MTVRMVKEEDPFAEAPALKLVAPVEPEALPPPVEVGVAPVPQDTPVLAPAPGPTIWQEAAIQALGTMTALAAILSIRLVLMLGLIAAFVLSFLGEHTILSTVNAAAFDILVVVPLIALALRKG